MAFNNNSAGVFFKIYPCAPAQIDAKILSLCCPLHADKSLIDGHAVQINVVLDENRE
jgi:hypothetical protein